MRGRRTLLLQHNSTSDAATSLRSSLALTYLCHNCSAVWLCGCSEACSLEGSADRQRQCCCSSPKPKQNQLPAACCLPPNVGNINLASSLHMVHQHAHILAHTHEAITLRTVGGAAKQTQAINSIEFHTHWPHAWVRPIN